MGLRRLRPVAQSLCPRALKACVKLSLTRAQARLAKAQPSISIAEGVGCAWRRPLHARESL